MKSRWFATGLIVVGLALLADTVGLVRVGWGTGLWGLLAVFGGYTLYAGFTKPSGRGVFWGTVFLAFGLYCVTTEAGLVVVPTHLQLPLILIVVGIALVLRFVRFPTLWAHLVAGALLLMLGGGIWLDEAGVVDTWQLRGIITMYWPVALILFGAAYLIPQKKAATHSE